MTNSDTNLGGLLRDWRQRRRLSQLELALDAEISARHLSFLETGRARPSREMVMRLSQVLEIPLRERNIMLLAAGFAPLYGERRLDDPDMAAARRAVDLVLSAHEPFPALAVDRHWTLVAANNALGPLLAGVPPRLMQGQVNVLRLSLHPDGLAPRIANLAEWRGHILHRLRRQHDASADPVLANLLEELEAYPKPRDNRNVVIHDTDTAGIIVPLCLEVGGTMLKFLSTTTIFGTPVDVTLSELAIESFFPADKATAAALHR